VGSSVPEGHFQACGINTMELVKTIMDVLLTPRLQFRRT
jgi:hypothetical protein